MAFTPGMERTLSVRVESDGVRGFTGAMDDAVASLGKFKMAVGAAGAALSALSVGALAVATKAAADFESAMIEVQKVTDASTAEAMRDEIMGLARTIPLAQSELAALAADAARFGIEGPENIRKFTEAVAKMATATDMSAQEAGQAFAKLATLTETPVSKIENLGSAINELSNNFATSSSEIVDSMMRSAAALSQLGLTQTEIIGLSTALNEVSESSERAGTRLRRVAQELMDPKKAEAMANALGMSVAEFEQMRKQNPTQLIVQLASTLREGGRAADQLRSTLSTTSRQALAGLGQNLRGTRRALDMANQSFKEGTSLQREFDAATSTFNSQLKLLKNLLRENAIEIGAVLLPPLTRLLKQTNQMLRSNDSLISGLSAQQKALGLVATAIGGAAVAAAAFVGGPAGLLIAAAGAIGAAYHTNFLGIRTEANETFAAMRAVWKEHAGPLLAEAREWAAIFRAFWSEWGDEITAIARHVWDAIGFVATSSLDMILTSVRVVSNLLQGDFKGAWSAAAGFVDRQTSRMLTEVEELATATVNAFSGLGGSVGDAMKKAINNALGLPFEHTIGEVVVEGETVFSGQTISIPALAEGGVVTGPTLAMIGEGGQSEAVVPLDRLEQLLSGDAAAAGGGGGKVVLELRDELLDARIEDGAQVVVQDARESRRRRNDRLGLRGG